MILIHWKNHNASQGKVRCRFEVAQIPTCYFIPICTYGTVCIEIFHKHDRCGAFANVCRDPLSIKPHRHIVFTVADTTLMAKYTPPEPHISVCRMDCCPTLPRAYIYFSLLMASRTTTQSHRQPVKLFKGSTNVIPQLYQRFLSAQCFITDQEG